MSSNFKTDINSFIGKQIRSLRRKLNLSQSELGDKIGLSFQQIQKYEKGVNKISASTLYMISVKLNTPITYFFGQPAEENLTEGLLCIEEDTQEFRYEVDTTEKILIETFNVIKNKKNKNQILKFLKAVSQ